MSKRNALGLTKKQAGVAADVKARGGVVPIGAFNNAMTPEGLAAHQDRLRSNATVPRAGAKKKAARAAGHTSRVGSRSAARRAAVRDY